MAHAVIHECSHIHPYKYYQPLSPIKKHNGNTISKFNNLLTSKNTKEKLILKIIDVFDVDLININHLYGFDFELVNKIKLRNIPMVLGLHDLFFATGSIDYLKKGIVKYLSGKEKQKMSKILDAFILKIFPSKFLQQEYNKLFNFTN